MNGLLNISFSEISFLKLDTAEHANFQGNQLFEDFPSFLVFKDDSRKKKKGEKIGGFLLLEIIGEGSKASVYKTIYKKEYWAVKKYQDEKDEPTEIILLRDNYDVFKKVPYCIHAKPYVIQANQKTNYLIKMPMLQSFIFGSSTTLTSSETALFLYQIGTALEYLHTHLIVHRDIKPQNVLIGDAGFVLCDFSVVEKLPSSSYTSTGVVGTSYYMAPEVSNTISYLPIPTDMWSLGVTVFHLIYGTLPFQLSTLIGKDDSQRTDYVNYATELINCCELEFPEFPFVSVELKEIISGLLKKNPLERMTSEELISNQWITKTYQERNQFLSFL